MRQATSSGANREAGDTAERARIGLSWDHDRLVYTVTLTGCGTLLCATSRADVAHRIVSELNRWHGR